ncbi:unnamed protein product [Adineta steineri]|uniref:PLAT domain-containing protein n=1 Tax=Adineta steineri TaxID=433720 RepID=A0A818QUL9_9BILA|nr:unnamed protein product [Adineta steineri]CAF3644538.1 unnamed protein product [Adineta steineri]
MIFIRDANLWIIYIIIGQILVTTVHASHFRGGTITWRPLNNTPSGPTVTILVSEQFSWRRSSYTCNDASIAAQSPMIGDQGSLTVVSGAYRSWISMTTQTYCTDYNINLDVSFGENSQTKVVPLGISFSIGYSSCCWLTNLVVGVAGSWSIVSQINTILRADGRINSSPFVATLPVIYKQINVPYAHVVQMSDPDRTDVLKCRWSNKSSNTNSYDECGGVCNGIPGAILNGTSCTITFTLLKANQYAVLALQIEDYYSNTTTTPMSSTPIQILFYGYASISSCSTPPIIIGNQTNGDPIIAPIGLNITENVIAQVSCTGTSIVEFLSSRPSGMGKSAIINQSPGFYEINFTWSPSASQSGLQGLCVAAVDNLNVQSDQWCITFLVTTISPEVTGPTIVQETVALVDTTFTVQDETIPTIPITTSTIPITTQTIQGCFSPTVTLIPGSSTLLTPVEFQRSRDFYIVSIIEFNCADSLLINTQWKIKSCNTNCSNAIQVGSSIITTSSELYIPEQTLPLGIYELELTVKIINMSNLTTTTSVYVEIIPTLIKVNLIQYATSMITHGYEENLLIDPGTYTVDPDEDTFNTTNWKYEYFCRIYGQYTFPNLNGTLLTIDDLRNDSSNPSCLTNRMGWEFNNSINSSITILSHSLQPNQTYQFMVQLINRRNSSIQSTGYLFVQIVDNHPDTILIGCVIPTACETYTEFQRVNPTTQVALFSVCNGNCTTIQNIKWNIYSGQVNSSLKITKWTLFNQTTMYENIWFFGINTSNLTVTDALFLANAQINHWRFEVVYEFATEKSLSSLNLVTNLPPNYGLCSISPLSGTTSTLFDILCIDWVDDDAIKDWTVYAWTNDLSERTIIAYSTLSTFQIRLPSGDNQTSLIHLIMYVRDIYDSTMEYNMSSVTVVPDSITINNFINDIQNSSSKILTNPICQLLYSGNQNLVGQTMILLSQYLNNINRKNLEKAFLNDIPITSISISSLGSQILQNTSNVSNNSFLSEYNKELNIYANIREYLINFTQNLPITISNSIKLQATVLAQITNETNQLTRTTLSIASNKCYKLAIALYSMATKISYEDAQTTAAQLIQCAANILSAVNGPLQERTTVLDLDYNRANKFPDDYDTDLDSEWSKLILFADGNDFSWKTIEINRNKYYQKELANELTNQMNDLISLLSSLLNIYLNIKQSSIINTSQVYMSLETISIDDLSNHFIKQIENGQIQFPQNFNLNQTNISKISIRSIMKPLVSFNNWTSSLISTNLSRSASFSILDQNGNEISIKTNSANPINIIIPRDPYMTISSMILQNVTSINSTLDNQFFHFHYVNITNPLPISVHFDIHPLNVTIAYLFIYKFDQIPSSDGSNSDGWTIFCPSNLTNESLYTYFINNQQTLNHQSIVFGFRELNLTEIENLCSNSSINMTLPIINQPRNFISNYELRIYTSGCFYYEKNNQWQYDGLIVGPLTNHFQTQCFSNHLTTFASVYQILPTPINWKYVFANADFSKNKTIYLTIIIVSIIYISLMIYARYKDRKDIEKLGVTFLPDNDKKDRYFYQILIFTGHRKDAGTKSKVHIVLSGDKDETRIRTLSDSHRQIFQRGGVNAFLMSVPKSLGLLNYARIWHDNTGTGSSSSWFLKYIIVRDLQTMEKFHFISQQWFAVEKDDGKIERILPVAGDIEKQAFSYMVSKNAYHSVSDGHLWFSIFSRPPSNQFTRVQRCTCCFVLFFISMFLNIMYYDLSTESKTNNSTSTASLSFGSFYLNSQQVIIGIIVELFALIPSLLLVQLFRRLQPRKKQLSPLQQVLNKIKPDTEIQNQTEQKTTKKKSSLSFPWWCIFIAYGFCIILVSVSIIFIIARGIEFGDEKTQKWLISILSGFFSSVLLTQPLKIIALAMFFAFFCRKSNDDKEANAFLDDNQLDLDNDEEYLHPIKKHSPAVRQSSPRVNRLNKAELIHARKQRLNEIQMWSILREVSIYLCFIITLYLIIYSNRDLNSYLQVNHLQKYLSNSRQIDCDFTKITTIDQYWNWLENSFVENIRAQKWYNNQPPRNLSGFINDKSNRFIGWATIRQLRVKSTLCDVKNQVTSTCEYDYSFFNEDKYSYKPGWTNETTQNYSSTIIQSFQYSTSENLDTYVYVGEHGTYSGNGYVYEFRGILSELQSNLSLLHQLEWINNQTRAIIIQLTLYNPNVQLFTSATLLAEFLSSTGVFTTARFEPMNFYSTVSYTFFP